MSNMRGSIQRRKPRLDAKTVAERHEALNSKHSIRNVPPVDVVGTVIPVDFDSETED